MKKIFKSCASVAMLTVAFASQAGVVFSSVNGTVAIEITSDISFVATGAADGITRFVFEDVYAIAPGSFGIGTLSNTIGLSVNGVGVTGLGTNTRWGPTSFRFGEIDPNDFSVGFVGFTGYGIGDVVTLKAGTARTAVAAAYLPTQQATQVVMTNNFGAARSAATTITPDTTPAADIPPTANTNAVPEPGSLALMGLALAGVAASRKRKA